jgi:hypothetical protein
VRGQSGCAIINNMKRIAVFVFVLAIAGAAVFTLSSGLKNAGAAQGGVVPCANADTITVLDVNMWSANDSGHGIGWVHFPKFTDGNGYGVCFSNYDTFSGLV